MTLSPRERARDSGDWQCPAPSAVTLRTGYVGGVLLHVGRGEVGAGQQVARPDVLTPRWPVNSEAQPAGAGAWPDREQRPRRNPGPTAWTRGVPQSAPYFLRLAGPCAFWSHRE